MSTTKKTIKLNDLVKTGDVIKLSTGDTVVAINFNDGLYFIAFNTFSSGDLSYIDSAKFNDDLVYKTKLLTVSINAVLRPKDVNTLLLLLEDKKPVSEELYNVVYKRQVQKEDKQSNFDSLEAMLNSKELKAFAQLISLLLGGDDE